MGGVNFCLGLRKDSNIDKYVPVSALQRNIKELTSNPSQILFIMEKNIGAADKFKKIKHVAKGLDLNTLKLSYDISEKITLKEYHYRN